MTNIAVHVRIFDSAPSDDLVTKRTAAIDELAKRFLAGKAVSEIFQTANDVSRSVELRGALSDALSKEVEDEIRKSSEAFVAEGNKLQIAVCGLLAALEALNRAKPSSGRLLVSDVLATGLWLGLSFQAPRSETKLEALRIETLNKARRVALATSQSARTRVPVPDFDLPETIDPKTLSKSLVQATFNTIEALRSNAVLDREELDLLWWVLTDHSAILDRPLSGCTPETAALASGLEVGIRLRRLPADAHHHLVLRSVKTTEPLTLQELLGKIADDRAQLATAISNREVVSACPALFPLMSALQSGSAAGTSAKIRRPLRDWTTRALVEGAALHLSSHLPTVEV